MLRLHTIDGTWGRVAVRFTEEEERKLFVRGYDLIYKNGKVFLEGIWDPGALEWIHPIEIKPMNWPNRPRHRRDSSVACRTYLLEEIGNALKWWWLTEGMKLPVRGENDG